MPPVAGQRYGRFAVQRLHARGGLGEVHVAVDEELGRNVALKRIQGSHAADPAARRRFLNEAAITARLEHPGIVPIYGLIQDEDAQPCYAMRFIAGQSLGDAIREWRRSPLDYRSPAFRQLLQRFISVCQTVGYAHSKQVVHRDIKPGNVMLGPFGETLVVDWGLAREFVFERCSPASEAKAPAAPGLLSTVNFAPSPVDEYLQTQAGEILGTPGYMSPEQAAGRWDVVGPRSDIYSLGATLYEMLTGRQPVSGQDQLEILQRVRAGDFPPPRAVTPRVPKPLEAICLKAMALDPANRYSAATQLAADVEDWLGDAPVAAFREPWLARIGRWLRRHRTAAVGGAAALTVLTLCAAAGAFMLGAANFELRQANAAEAAQRQAALTSAEEARLAQRRAEAAFGKAREAVEKSFQTVTEDPDLRAKHDLLPLRRKLLETAMPFYVWFTEQKPGETAEVERGQAFGRLARVRADLGDREMAIADLGQMIDIFAKLTAQFPSNSDYRRVLAATQNNRGILFRETGRLADAEAAHRQALELEEQLVADFPDIATYRQDLASNYNNLGLLLQGQGKLPDAEKAFRQAQLALEKLAADSPEDTRVLRTLAMVENNLGELLRIQGKRTDAEDMLRRGLDLRERLAAAQPGEPQRRHEVAQSLNKLALADFATGRLNQAKASLLRALTLLDELCRDFPSTPAYRQDLAVSCNDLALVLIEWGQSTEAEAYLTRGLKVREKLVEEYRSIVAYRDELASSYTNYALFLKRQHQPEKSLGYWQKAITLLEPGPGQQPRPGIGQRLLATHSNCADTLMALGRDADAVREWERAIDWANEPTRPALRIHRARALARSGAHAQAVADAEALATIPSLAAPALYNLACIHSLAAAAAKDDATLQDRYADRAVELLRHAVKKGYKDVEHLKKDDDLKGLREREDFHKLTQELEEKKSP